MSATTTSQVIILIISLVNIVCLIQSLRKKGFNAIAISLLIWLINATAWLVMLLLWKPDLTATQIEVINLWSWIVRGHAALAISAGLYYACFKTRRTSWTKT